MNAAFDSDAINHMTVALNREMSPRGGKAHRECDTLFMGGGKPTDANQDALAKFGLSKNWKIIYPFYNLADINAGPAGFHTVVTDGLTQSILLFDGLLWKRDRQSASVLLFPESKVLVKVNSRGRLIVQGMATRYHDHGFDLAREALLGRASRKPGHAPVMSAIGSMPTVLDIHTLNAMFAVGE